MRKHRKNKALLSVFLSAILMMSGTFQAFASDVSTGPDSESKIIDVVETADPVNPEIKLAEPPVEIKDEAILPEVIAEEPVSVIEEILPDVVADEPISVTEDILPDVIADEPVSVTEAVESIKLPEVKKCSLFDLNKDLRIRCGRDWKFNWDKDWDWSSDCDFDCDLDFNWGDFPDFDWDNLLIPHMLLKFEKEWHPGAGYNKFVIMELWANDGKGAKKVAYFPLVHGVSNWKLSFAAPSGYLDKNLKFHKFEYTVKEKSIHGYETEINKEAYKIGLMDVNKFTIHNYQLGKLDVKKDWDDNDDKLGLRPLEVEYQVLKNGIPYGEVKKLTKEGNWEDKLVLPMFDKENKKIDYTIEELPVEGYETSYSHEEIKKDKHCPSLHPDIEAKSILITNKLKDIVPDPEPELITIKGEKTWDDLMKRPAKITVKLLRNGLEFMEKEVKADADGKWCYEFKDIEKLDGEGKAYKYSIEEVKITGYTVTVDGYNLKNYQSRATLTVHKVDKDKVGLPGAVFGIYELDGTLIKTLTSGPDGTFEIILPLGMYRVTEITPPKGYDKKDISRLVILTKNGEEFKLEIENVKSKDPIKPLPNDPFVPGGGKPLPTLPKTGSVGQPILYVLGLFSLFVGVSELRRKKRV